MNRFRSRRRFCRALTPLTLFCFVWSAVVSPYSRAFASRQVTRTRAATAYTLGYDFDGQLTSISGGTTASFTSGNEGSTER